MPEEEGGGAGDFCAGGRGWWVELDSPGLLEDLLCWGEGREGGRGRVKIETQGREGEKEREKERERERKRKRETLRTANLLASDLQWLVDPQSTGTLLIDD